MERGRIDSRGGGYGKKGGRRQANAYKLQLAEYPRSHPYRGSRIQIQTDQAIIHLANFPPLTQSSIRNLRPNALGSIDLQPWQIEQREPPRPRPAFAAIY